MSDVLAVCDLGHEFTLKDFDPEAEVIAAISWCPEMLASPQHFGLILECGAKVLWLRHLPGLDKKQNKRILPKESIQYDLFLDNEIKLTLDKSKSND